MSTSVYAHVSNGDGCGGFAVVAVVAKAPGDYHNFVLVLRTAEGVRDGEQP